jgi:hypothetical protein
MPEPGDERVSKPQVIQVSDPGHISVGPSQDAGGRLDRLHDRKLPGTFVSPFDRLNPVSPGSNVEAAGLTEVVPGGEVAIRWTSS